MSVLSAPHFHNEKAAYAYVEARIWPNGPICPHCGGFERIGLMGGKSTRIGAYKCYQCRKPFTVKVGTIFEASHVPLRFWLQAMFLMASSKKGISANQLHRTLGVTLKTAWFMAHRIREAMREGGLAPFGEGGGIVESDETFIGRDPAEPIAKAGGNHKMKVLTLVDRSTGRARSEVLDFISAKAIGEIVVANLSKEAILMTDEATHYKKLGRQFAGQARRTTPRANTSPASIRWSTATPSRAISASSSVGCAASISTAPSATCTAIWRSSISATRTASRGA